MAFERRRSPRERRLNSDFRALQELSKESSILDFQGSGSPPEQYRISFHGKGLFRVPDSTDVMLRDYHEVTITLTSAYPRMIPELAWQTPIFHPNISASGVVCLGGYGTHWVPSLMIDELCKMLWDMIRYRNFDIESPYNREAAVWTKNQTLYTLPVDDRPLRNIVNDRTGRRDDRGSRFPATRESKSRIAAATNAARPPFKFRRAIFDTAYFANTEFTFTCQS